MKKLTKLDRQLIATLTQSARLVGKNDFMLMFLERPEVAKEIAAMKQDERARALLGAQENLRASKKTLAQVTTVLKRRLAP